MTFALEKGECVHVEPISEEEDEEEENIRKQELHQLISNLPALDDSLYSTSTDDDDSVLSENDGHGDHGDKDYYHGNGHGDHGDGQGNYGNAFGTDSLVDQIFYDHQVEEQHDTTENQRTQLNHLPKLIQPLPPQPDSSQPLPPQPDQSQPLPPQLNSSQPLPPQPNSSHPLPPPPQPHPPNPLPDNHYSLKQLEVLYKARGRQLTMLTQQLSAQKEDGEVHIKILRQEKELLENERDVLSERLREFGNRQQVLEKEVFVLRGELSAEKTKSEALEKSKNELMSSLVSAEASIHSLNQQVEELNSSECIARIRESYNSALLEASHKHRDELATFQEQIQEIKEQMEAKDNTIQLLNQELTDLRTLREPRNKPHLQGPPTHQHHDRNGDVVVQQLEFGTMMEEGEGEGRLVELAKQVEDLTFKLSTLSEELEEAMGRAETAETALSEVVPQLSRAEGKIEALRGQVLEQQAQLERFKVEAESEKRAALEQCRSACLKLHEDSTLHLRESMTSEKEKIAQDLNHQISLIKSDLAAVQEQYVVVCGEKERLREEVELISKERSEMKKEIKKMTEREAKQEEAVCLAVEEARKEWERDGGVAGGSIWKGEETKGTKDVKFQASETFEKSEDEEVVKLREEMEKREEEKLALAREEWEDEKRVCVEEAVKGARIQWLKEREATIQSRIESAVNSAQRLWKQDLQARLKSVPQNPPKVTGKQSSSKGGSRVGGGATPVKLPPDEAAIADAVSRARTEWEASYEEKIQASVLAAKKDCEATFNVVLASEREKWLDEGKNASRQREVRLLEAAHEEWRATQQVLLQAEVERAKKEGEEAMRTRIEMALQSSLLDSKKQNERILEDVRERHRREKAVLTEKIKQLEGDVARCLQERDKSAEVDLQRNGGCGVDVDQIKEVLRSTILAVKTELTHVVKKMDEEKRLFYEQKLQEMREKITKEVKRHYLQRLHQLVNSHDQSCDFGVELQHESFGSGSASNKMVDSSDKKCSYSSSTIKSEHATKPKESTGGGHYLECLQASEHKDGSHDSVEDWKGLSTCTSDVAGHDSGPDVKSTRISKGETLWNEQAGNGSGFPRMLTLSKEAVKQGSLSSTSKPKKAPVSTKTAPAPHSQKLKKKQRISPSHKLTSCESVSKFVPSTKLILHTDFTRSPQRVYWSKAIGGSRTGKLSGRSESAGHPTKTWQESLRTDT